MYLDCSDLGQTDSRQADSLTCCAELLVSLFTRSKFCLQRLVLLYKHLASIHDVQSLLQGADALALEIVIMMMG